VWTCTSCLKGFKVQKAVAKAPSPRLGRLNHT
jgi:hypothetical protein